MPQRNKVNFCADPPILTVSSETIRHILVTACPLLTPSEIVKDGQLLSKRHIFAATLVGFAAATASTAYADTNARLPGQHGVASWYGPGFYGRKTANGERYTGKAMTAAHRYLPFGTHVRVTDKRSGRSIVVRINDRGPFKRGRVIDLSTASARALGVSGIANVVVTPVVRTAATEAQTTTR